MKYVVCFCISPLTELIIYSLQLRAARLLGYISINFVLLEGELPPHSHTFWPPPSQRRHIHFSFWAISISQMSTKWQDVFIKLHIKNLLRY